LQFFSFLLTSLVNLVPFLRILFNNFRFVRSVLVAKDCFTFQSKINVSEDICSENKKKGCANWKIVNPGMPYIQGYVSHISLCPKEKMFIYVNSHLSYRVEIYRMGYYSGLGARLMHVIENVAPSFQEYREKAYLNGCNWHPSIEFEIPSNWPSGFYLIKLIDKKGREAYASFILRQKIPIADFVVLLASNTYHAYNNWGGKSLYSYNSSYNKQAVAVSFKRPYADYNGAGLFFQYEYNLVRWLEKHGFSITYVSDLDIHKGVLSKAIFKTLIIAGHSEYWTFNMRKDVEKLNINIANFCANVCYWQVRLTEKNDGMVCFKQFASKDPYIKKNPKLTTTRFRQYPVNMPEDSLFGIMYKGIVKQQSSFVVTNSRHFLYQGTGLNNGYKIDGVIGGEIDGYFGRPNVEIIAKSPVMLTNNKIGESCTVWYNRPNGCKVFSAGTFCWNWFLDNIHYPKVKVSGHIQRITYNALKALNS